MPDAPDPKAIAQQLMPQAQFDFALAIAAVHKQMFDQMLTLGLTVQARLIIPAADQPRLASRSIDAPDTAVCGLVRAIRDLSLASERIMNQAKAASSWQTCNQFGSVDIERMEDFAEAVARRAIEPISPPAPAIQSPAEDTAPDFTDDGTDVNTVPFPTRRAKH